MTEHEPGFESPAADSTTVNDAPPALPSRRRPLRRVGCVLLLVVWFVLLLSPCLLIVLATQGQIVISQGDLPEQEIRLWLIMESDQRGIGFSSTSTSALPDAFEADGACLQTTVRYWLWQGVGDGSVYCTCWAKDTSDGWAVLATYPSPCPE